MKNTINWESASVYHLNISIFKGRIAVAKDPNLEDVLVTQSSPTLCDSVDCSLPGSMEFSRWEYWSQLPFPSSRDLPDWSCQVEPGSPALQAGSLPAKSSGNPLEPHVIRTPPSRKDRQGRSEILLAFCWLNPLGWCTENLNNSSLS